MRNLFFFSLVLLVNISCSGQAGQSDKVLFTSGGHRYTQTYWNGMQDFLEFLFDTKLNSADIRMAKIEIEATFMADPAGTIQQSIDLGQQMEQLRQQRDVQNIGLARSIFLYHFYNAYIIQDNAGNIGKLLRKYVNVLALDHVNQLALTSSDVENLCNLSEFISELNGQVTKVSKSERKQVSEQMTQHFSTLNLEEKKLLCSMTLFYPYLRRVYDQSSSTDKAHFKNQFAYNSSTSGAASSFQDLERQMWRQQMMYDMNYRWMIHMRNMMDDKYYWEIRRY